MAQGCRYDDDVLPGSLSVPAKGESWAIDIGALKCRIVGWLDVLA
jgi:hypothetical protein